MIDPKHIVTLQGREFVKYEGLLDTAHKLGLHSIKTTILQLPTSDNPVCIVHATAKTDKGEFDGVGDAAPHNVNRVVAQHVIRMAETRAKARALRDLTNIGMTAVEELGGDEPPKRMASVDERRRIVELGRAHGKSTEQLKELVQQMTGKTSTADLTAEEAASLIRRLEEVEHGESH